MSRVLVSILAALALIPAGSAAGASAPAVNAVQCFIVATVYSKAGTEQEKQIARTTEVYYLGRLSGNGAALKAEFAKQLKIVTNENSAAIMTACTKAMSNRAQEISSMQRELARSIKR